MCVLGNRLLQEDGSGNCTKKYGNELYNSFCKPNELDGIMCDPYYEANEPKLFTGIRGLASGVLKENLWPAFMEQVHRHIYIEYN
jgi:hypothetical protein